VRCDCADSRVARGPGGIAGVSQQTIAFVAQDVNSCCLSLTRYTRFNVARARKSVAGARTRPSLRPKPPQQHQRPVYTASNTTHTLAQCTHTQQATRYVRAHTHTGPDSDAVKNAKSVAPSARRRASGAPYQRQCRAAHQRSRSASSAAGVCVCSVCNVRSRARNTFCSRHLSHHERR
jgi:hypothetical protein